MIVVDVKHRPGKLTAIARGLSKPFGVGEVYVNGVLNRQKAADLAARGHDPLAVPRGNAVAKAARAAIRRAIVTGEAAAVRRALLGAAQAIALWLRRRIMTGGLGHNSPATEQIKRDLVRRGLATRAYGVPPPYGVQTGKLVKNILARWRNGR